MVGIISFGGYVPRLRLSRKSIVEAHCWADPSLRGKAKGERAMCNWDEDSITMGVEAARDCYSTGMGSPDAVFFATTSSPFIDRQGAGVLVEALSLGKDIVVLDAGASQRAGTSALLQALAATKGGTYKNILVVASEHRKTQAASPQEFALGDGAVAVTVGEDNVILEYLGGHSTTVDFVDHFRGEGQEFDYTWEERWIRDEGYMKIVPPTINEALGKSNMTAQSIDHFILPSTIGRAVNNVAKVAEISNAALRDNLAATCGDTGVAHPLMMLLHTIEGDEVKPGQIIMVASFGQGCDVLIFRVTENLAKLTKPNGVRGALANRQEENNYQRFLAFNGLLKVDRGMRAERDNKTALTVLYRKRDMLLGLVGGKCTKCGTPQFPRQDVCVNPDCAAAHTQEPYSFVNETAKIQSWSADYLTYTIDPPSHYGMIVFDNGGRFMTDFTDVQVGEIDVGMKVRMVFRIKGFDERRGFVRYFWKAVPVR